MLYQVIPKGKEAINVDYLNIMQMAEKIHAWRERIARQLYIALDFPDPFKGL